jgi:phosphomannomutase
MNYDKIFKAYDIRGVYGEDLNEDTAFKIGQAFAVFLKNKFKKEDLNIVLGKDNRLSSNSLFSFLKRGIMSQGANVIDVSLSTTPLFYFSTAHFNYDGGIVVTASHNPPQYNGFKMVGPKAEPINENTGLKEIKDIILKDELQTKQSGTEEKKCFLKEYVSFNLFQEDFSNFKIVVDTANSVAGIVISDMLKNINVIHLFKELDGKFPNHEPNPSKQENLEYLKQKLIEEKANIGIAFDGDGDRILFLDELGETVSSDLILALMVSLILKQKPNAKILYDIRSSNIVKETITNLGGIAVLSRVGHSPIKEKMIKEDIYFGGEYTGHFFCKDHYFGECPFFVLFNVLKAMKQENKTLSQLINPYKKYFHSGEINFEVENKEEKIKQFKEKYKEGIMTEIDGLRIDFPDWWFLVRASNTEPLLRIIVEAKTRELMTEKVSDLTKLL